MRVLAEVKAITTSIIVLHPAEPRVLCVRHPAFHLWMFPGGHVDDGEAPHVAVLRELDEEVGLTVQLLDHSELPQWSLGGNRRLPQPLAIIEEALPDGGCYVDMIYVGLAYHANLRFTSEIDTAEWFDIVQLRGLQTTYPIRELSAHVLAHAPQFRMRTNR